MEQGYMLPSQAKIVNVHPSPPSGQLRRGEVHCDELQAMKAMLAQNDQQLEVEGINLHFHIYMRICVGTCVCELCTCVGTDGNTFINIDVDTRNMHLHIYL